MFQQQPVEDGSQYISYREAGQAQNHDTEIPRLPDVPCQCVGSLPLSGKTGSADSLSAHAASPGHRQAVCATG